VPSFTWTSRFRETQWRAFRKFMLEERRDASSRFAVIDAERQRIGSVWILWHRDDNGKVTEKRDGIAVTPPDSSLAKLLAAYTALGGNPFDISMFMGPERTVDLDGVVTQTQPGGGVVHPQDIKYSYDAGVTDGDTNLAKYRYSRVGGRGVTAKDGEILGIVQRSRKWINKEIEFKRNRLEERIIKLMDLREQLDEEVSDLVWATYGDTFRDQTYESDRFNDSLTAAGIAYFFDSTFRIPNATDPTSVTQNDQAEKGEPGSSNLAALAGYTGLQDDLPEEENSAL